MGNKVLVVDGGGRGHTFARQFALSPHVDIVFCAPGNGGTAREPKCRNVDIRATDVDSLVKFAIENDIDLTVPGQEAPLVAGIVDQFPDHLPIWGPGATAALLEGDKIFAKEAMDRHGIPTAPWKHFGSAEAANDWLSHEEDKSQVVKASGLTGGKGAIVCTREEETRGAIDLMSSFGEAGRRFIIEKRLVGREASLFLLCSASGEIIPLVTAQDYKRLLNGDAGPNTGGMASYSPASHLDDAMIEEIIAKLRPMIEATGFTGFLYVGIMLTVDGWYVLEFNVRMGDPETQVVLPRLETDLYEFLYTMTSDGHYPGDLKWSDKSAVTIVVASGGYPGDYKTGYEIYGLDTVEKLVPEAVVFHAGTKLIDGKVYTSGGRVFGVTALGDGIQEARTTAYRARNFIDFQDAYSRDDAAEGIDN